MRLKKSLLPVTLLAVSLFTTSTDAGALCVKAGSEAPAITLNDIEGEKVHLSDHRGKVVMLAFWASWCPRCMEELEYLQTLADRFPKQLSVFAINQDTQNVSPRHIEKLKKEIKDRRLTFTVLIDGEFEVWKDYCINALPTSVILDREGRVEFAEPNYYWESKKKISGVLAQLGLDITQGD